MHRLAIVAPSLIIAACATVTIQSVGPDTYMADAGMTHAGAREGEQFCARQGKRFMVTKMEQSFYGAQVVFRCLAPSDPELKRPVL